LIEADDSTLSLNRGPLSVDVWDFDRAMEEGDYRRAVDLWGGPFLGGYERKLESELSHWAEAQNERIRSGLEVAYARLVTRALRDGELESAVHYAGKYAEDFPLHDSAQATLIQTLRAVGKDVEALRAYEAYRQLLRDELGDTPGEELEEAAAAAREALLAPLGEATRVAAQALGNDGVSEAGSPGAGGSGTLVRSLTIGSLAGLGIVLAVLTALTLWVRGWPLGDVGTGLSVEIPVMTRDGDVAAVVVRDNDLRVELRDTALLAEYRVRSPDGTRLAFAVDTEGGYNIAVTNLKSGDTSVVISGPEDELPHQWSPDGRCLLYVFGVPLDQGRDYVYRLGILDLSTGVHRALTETVFPTTNSGAVWSPYGTRIAFTGREGELERVFVVKFDGSDLLAVSPEGESAGDPAWSLDGSRLAFAMGPRGSRAVYTVWADGSELERVTSPVGDSRSPVWVSNAALAFFSDRNGTRALWLLELRNGRGRRLSDDPALVSSLPNRSRPSGSDGGIWIEKLRIDPRMELVSPGQHLSFEVEATDTQGRRVSQSDMPIRWSVSDTNVAWLHEAGRVEIRATGMVQIVASAGGWRADTLLLESRQLVQWDIEPAFVDDWTEGLDPNRFILYGSPLPFTRPVGGPEGGGVFLSNGDDAFTSGVLTRETFPLMDGVTIEVWGRMPFSGNHWEDFCISLFSRPPPGDSLDWRDGVGVSRIVDIQIHGRDRVVRVRGLFDQGSETAGYFPADPERWSLWALQVETDGTVTIVHDGLLRWRSAWQLPLNSIPQAHVGLGYASRDNEIVHGKLRIYLGTKYAIADSP
jgi:hypothetical protein